MNILFADMDSFSKQKGTYANLENGAISEHISTTIYKKNGYTQINAEVGRNGMDGLFIKKLKNGDIKVIVSEVKHGNGKLGYIIDPNNSNKKIKQMSKEWQLIKLDKKIKSLDIVTDKDEIKLLKQIKSKINRGQVKSQITRVTNLGDNKFSISIDELNSDGSVGKQLKHKINDNIIDLSKQYKVGSDSWKLQKTISHSVRKEKRLLSETKKLNNLKDKLRDLKKKSTTSKSYLRTSKALQKQNKLIKKIKKSRPKFMNSKNLTKSINKSTKTSKALKGVVPIIFMKKGKKVVAFMSVNIFKKTSKITNKMKFLKNVKGGDIVMMAITNGVVIYSVLKGGANYKAITGALLGTAKSLAGQGFEKGLAIILAPYTIIAIVGTMAVEYAIDKYIELDKRNYIGIEDLLWDVPDEVKNRITVLNLEDTKKETVFDFGDIDKETILDDDVDGETILEDSSNNKESILDY